MGNLTKYQGYDLDTAAADARRGESIDGNSFVKLEEGENVLRFMPPPIGSERRSPFRVTAQHYLEIPGHDRKYVFSCPRVELGEPCAICQLADLLGRSGNPTDRKMADEFRASRRVFTNVIVRGNESAGAQVFAFGRMIQKKLDTIRRSQRTGGDFTNPGPDGFDVVVIREGTGMATRYDALAERDRRPMFELDDGSPDVNMIEEIIENQHDLEQFIKPAVPDEVAEWVENRMRQITGKRAARPAGARRAAARPDARRLAAGEVEESTTPPADVVDADFDDLDNDLGPLG